MKTGREDLQFGHGEMGLIRFESKDLVISLRFVRDCHNVQKSHGSNGTLPQLLSVRIVYRGENHTIQGRSS